MRPPADADLRQPRILHECTPQWAHFKGEQNRHYSTRWGSWLPPLAAPTPHNLGRIGSTLAGSSARICPVKRSTAIGHLVDTGEVASEQLKFRGTDIG
jgi:hypothetical protein